MNRKIPMVFAIITLIAISSFCLVNAQPSVTSPTPTIKSGLTSRSYIRINGVAELWGSTDVKGMLQTQARIGTFESGDTKQFASATAMWTTNLMRPIMTALAKEDFTYVFYEARLRNAAVSELITGSSTEDYVLSGTWNLVTVTTKVTFDKNDEGKIIGVHRTMDKTIEEVYGELRVTDNFSEFTLSLVGIEPVSGRVVRSVIRQFAFNPFKVTEDITTNFVTRADVAAVIRAFGAMPGHGLYNPRMDFRGHFKVDITSLSTVASNL